MSSHRFGPMETGRDMSAVVLLWPPKSLYDASLEPMVCRHAHNLPARRKALFSRLGDVANKGMVTGTLLHWLPLYQCTEVSNGQKPPRMQGKRAWQLLERAVSFSGLIAAHPLLTEGVCLLYNSCWRASSSVSISVQIP